jgi:thiol-disulfide isomerase/thioredoxin
MVKLYPRIGAVLFLIGGLLSVNLAMADHRPKEKILDDIKAVEFPPLPRDKNDRVAIQDFVIKRQKAMDLRYDLIGELSKGYPESPELVTLMPERWEVLGTPGPKASQAKAEIEAVLASSKNEKLVAEAAFMKLALAVQKAGDNAEAADLMPAGEAFIKKAPKDPRGAMFLDFVAQKERNPARKLELEKRIEKDYPDSPVFRMKVRKKAAEARVKDAIGKPFPLEFTDALKGGQISMATLKGKVVIIDFWATWCPTCMAEMPHMKKLYAEYKDKGVEFIGINLDEPKLVGGFDRFKDSVEKNKIEWPQFYDPEGKGDLAIDWGITMIPVIFAVDAEGNLASMHAEGRLETLIPELLAKARKPVVKPGIPRP